MTRRLAFLALFLIVACRTGRPSGAPVAPLTAPTSDAMRQLLREQRAQFHGMKSLMRVRATRAGQTQSFRAQLSVHDARRMELIAFTPVGTAALTMKADGNTITSDPPVPPNTFDFLRAADLAPAEVAMLLLGIPPRDDLPIEVGPAGIASASAGGVTVTFDPPSFPAKRVVIVRGSDRVEIEHLEVVSE
jgi:hypothetical protein